MQRRSLALLSSTFHHLVPNSWALERAESAAPLGSHSLCTFSCCCPRNSAGKDAQASHPVAPEGSKDPVFGANPLFSRGEEDHLLPPISISSFSPASLRLRKEATLPTRPWGLKSYLALSSANFRAV